VITREIMSVVRGDNGNVEVSGKLTYSFNYLLFLGNSVILNLQIKPVFAEYLGEFRRLRVRSIRFARTEKIPDNAVHSRRKRDQPFRTRCQQLFIYPWFMLKTFSKCFRGQIC